MGEAGLSMGKTLCIAYGKKEVESWYWELWNEPDSPYWNGTLEEFFKLYDYTADGARKALANGKNWRSAYYRPSGNRGAKFLHAFIKHCISGTNYATGKTALRLILLLFMQREARMVDGHVRMDMGSSCSDIDSGFKIATIILH